MKQPSNNGNCPVRLGGGEGPHRVPPADSCRCLPLGLWPQVYDKNASAAGAGCHVRAAFGTVIRALIQVIPQPRHTLAATNKCLARSNKSRTASSLTCLQALLRLFRDLMQGLQTTFVVIIAAAAFLAGLCGERLRAKLARQAWQKRRWRRGQGVVPFKTGAAPVTDPVEQLRLVMGAEV